MLFLFYVYRAPVDTSPATEGVTLSKYRLLLLIHIDVEKFCPIYRDKVYVIDPKSNSKILRRHDNRLRYLH